MALHQAIKDYLQSEGYAPKDTDFGFEFTVNQNLQALQFIHFKDEARANFLNLFFPQIFEVTEENRQDVLTAINETNGQIIVAKGSIRFGNAVWVGVESFVPQNVNMAEVVKPALESMLEYRQAFYHFYAQTPTGKKAVEAAQAEAKQ